MKNKIINLEIPKEIFRLANKKRKKKKKCKSPIEGDIVYVNIPKKKLKNMSYFKNKIFAVVLEKDNNDYEIEYFDSEKKIFITSAWYPKSALTLIKRF